MRTLTVSARITASLLSVMLISCGSSRYTARAHPEQLSHFVLFIQDQPDGTVTHSWRRAEEVDLSQYSPMASQHIVLTMGRKRDCDEENRECIRECMSRPLPQGFGHITSGRKGRGGKEEYCNNKCMQPYLDCTKLQELEPHEFSAADKAVDWLKRHYKPVLLGSVVIIAGVAFVVLSAGTGLVILAPAVLLASPTAGTQHYMVEAAP
ncbi:hypothetical protein [Stigmatella erecta]|nr:hypothetical protein [Stigmatella erecta]